MVRRECLQQFLPLLQLPAIDCPPSVTGICDSAKASRQHLRHLSTSTRLSDYRTLVELEEGHAVVAHALFGAEEVIAHAFLCVDKLVGHFDKRVLLIQDILLAIGSILSPTLCHDSNTRSCAHGAGCWASYANSCGDCRWNSRWAGWMKWPSYLRPPCLSSERLDSPCLLTMFIRILTLEVCHGNINSRPGSVTLLFKYQPSSSKPVAIPCLPSSYTLCILKITQCHIRTRRHRKH